jgi:hypothetical protein
MTAKGEYFEVTEPEIRELLVGTWLAIGLVADALAEARELDREELFTRLVDAEADARQSGRQRYMAFAAVRWIFESLGEARQASMEANGPTRRRRSRPRSVAHANGVPVE